MNDKKRIVISALYIFSLIIVIFSLAYTIGYKDAVTQYKERQYHIHYNPRFLDGPDQKHEIRSTDGIKDSGCHLCSCYVVVQP